MNELIKLLLVAFATFLALYLGVWFLILPIGMIYGYFTHWTTLKSGLMSFITVFAVWSITLVVRDAGFAHSPIALFAEAAGGLPSWAVPVLAGFIGGLLALLGTTGARLLRKS